MSHSDIMYKKWVSSSGIHVKKWKISGVRGSLYLTITVSKKIEKIKSRNGFSVENNFPKLFFLA